MSVDARALRRAVRVAATSRNASEILADGERDELQHASDMIDRAAPVDVLDVVIAIDKSGLPLWIGKQFLMMDNRKAEELPAHRSWRRSR